MILEDLANNCPSCAEKNEDTDEVKEHRQDHNEVKKLQREELKIQMKTDRINHVHDDLEISQHQDWEIKNLHSEL
jgi:hypothetical protein